MQDPNLPIIDIPPQVEAPESAVHFLIMEMVRTGRLPADSADEVTNEIWHREKLGSTAVINGIAVPNARSKSVKKPLGIIGRCRHAIEWPTATETNSVSLICLILMQVDCAPGDYLRQLETFVRQIRAA